jgi:hypothetical protein
MMKLPLKEMVYAFAKKNNAEEEKGKVDLYLMV